MKPNSKDRLKVFLIIAPFLLLVSICIFSYYVRHTHKVSGMGTYVQIVKVGDVQQIEHNKKYLNTYAIKMQEDSKYYLMLYGVSEDKPFESKVALDREQYNSLVEDKEYWLEIKYLKVDDERNSKLKRISNEDPAKY